MIAVLDLNSDLGELPGHDGAALDDDLLAVITSANVACGGHAGDAESMSRVCARAADRGVAIGAQVSYVDPDNFGRVRLDVPAGILTDQLAAQIGDLQSHAIAAASSVSYVKPHGALYHAAATDPDVARAVVDAITAYGAALPVLTTPGSELARAARSRGLIAVEEAFLDRGYLPDGRLVPRSEVGALITDPDAIRERVTTLVRDEVVVAIDGRRVALRASSACVHCDTPGASQIARLARSTLESLGVAVRPFIGPST